MEEDKGEDIGDIEELVKLVKATQEQDKYETYEDYLDGHLTEDHKLYLEDRELARQLLEYCHNNQPTLLKREDFEEKKKQIEEARKNKNVQQPKQLASAGLDLSHSRFLQELAKKEEDIKNGRLKTILFLRYEEFVDEGEHSDGEGSPTKKSASPTKAGLLRKEKMVKSPVKGAAVGKKEDAKKEPVIEKKREISGYIDLAQRFQSEDFRPYFTGAKLLLPRNGDLSYFNWKTQNPTASDSRNFRVIANTKVGLLFRNKLDRKDIDVNPDLVCISF